MAASVCHAGFCVPEAAADKDSFCDKLNGAWLQQQQAGSMQELGAAVVSAAVKVQQELEGAATGGNRRFLQDQVNTLNLATAPPPLFNITVPAVSSPQLATAPTP